MMNTPRQLAEIDKAAVSLLADGGTAREKADRLQKEMEALPQVECPITHHFAPGLYGREMHIPAGVSVVGAVHKVDNIAVVSAGAIWIATDEGAELVRAPATRICKAGTKNVGAAVEDTVWTNFFPTTETDLNKIIEAICESSADELMGGQKNKQLLANDEAKKLGGE